MLTDAQNRVYSAILSLSVTKGRTPRYREIAEKLGIKSLSTINKHIGAMLRKGWLVRSSAHELEIVPKSIRNGLRWWSCDRDHAQVLFQVHECPVCKISVNLLKSQQEHVSP